MGLSLHSCVEVREPIELSFGVVSTLSGVRVMVKVNLIFLVNFSEVIHETFCH